MLCYHWPCFNLYYFVLLDLEKLARAPIESWIRGEDAVELHIRYPEVGQLSGFRGVEFGQHQTEVVEYMF